MLEFLKRLLGLGPKVEQVAAPYKVEAPAPVVETAPVAAVASAQAGRSSRVRW